MGAGVNTTALLLSRGALIGAGDDGVLRWLHPATHVTLQEVALAHLEGGGRPLEPTQKAKPAGIS